MHSKQRLIVWLATSKRVAADLLSIEVNLATHQTIGPLSLGGESSREQVNAASLVGTTQEDYLSMQRALQVKTKLFRESGALWSMLATCGATSAVGSDIAIGLRRHMRQAEKLLTLPDLRLPQTIERLNGVLLTRRCKYGGDAQREAQARYSTEGISKLVGALKDRTIVELRKPGQALKTPTGLQIKHYSLRAEASFRPRVYDPAMQAGARQHRKQRACGDLQILDPIKAVQFGLPASHSRQVPTLWGCRPDALDARDPGRRDA